MRKSRTSTSSASSACRRLIPRRPNEAKICLRKDLANLSSLRLIVDSCTPKVRAISAKANVVVDLDLSYVASSDATTDRPKQAAGVAGFVLGKVPG